MMLTFDLNEADFKLIIGALRYAREYDTYREEDVDLYSELINRLTRIRLECLEVVDLSDIPEAGEEFFKKAKLRKNDG
jgi:hypothetical protein